MNEQYTMQVAQPSGLLNIFWECLPLINLVLAVMATVRCVKRGQQGLALVLWLIFIWLVPIIGSLVALYAIRRATPRVE